MATFAGYKKRLNSFMFLGILCGLFLGIFLPDLSLSFSLVGNLFLRSLMLLIIPVIVVSMISGILNLDDAGTLGRLGVKALAFYAATTAIAVITGLLIVNIIQPGVTPNPLEIPSSSLQSEGSMEGTPEKGLTKVIENIIPKNVVKAAVDGNVLGLIFFSVFLGIALLCSNPPGLPTVRAVMSSLYDAVIWMVDQIMLVAPIGVFSLVATLAANLTKSGTLTQFGGEIGEYCVTVIIGLLFHALISLPLIAIIFKINPLEFAKAMFPAVSTAFSTASSSATLPITIESLRDRAEVSNRVSSFVAPLGATVNMDGTAIYEAVAALFIANMYGIELSFTQQVVVFLTATFSAIGAAGIPGAGLIMMTLVLNSVGIPVEGIQIVIIVDRALDMLRTSINVWGDSIGAAIIARSEGETVLTKQPS